MSAIARVLLERGQAVSGSDSAPSLLLDRLSQEGVDVAIGHTADNVRDASIVVVSSAIDRNNPEFAAARRAGTTVLHRGEMLARLMQGRRGIAICGTHGKTTTTAMTHAVLRAGGIDAGLILGGIDGTLNTNAHDGTSPWFVTEADESDGSFALLEPDVAVVINVENDHLASDDELPALVRAFAEFLGKLPDRGAAIVGTDNVHSASLASHDLPVPVTRFGFGAQADVRATNLRFDRLGSQFDVIAGGACLGTAELPVPGAMNVQNALGAIAVARLLEVPFARVAEALRGFRSVRRRFDVLADVERMIVVDDYAHHPTAVAATIAAARGYHRGLLFVAFQPHRYSRTAFLAAQFAQALAGADRVYLAPVYAASEPAIPGVSERSIGKPLEAAGATVRYVPGVDALEDVLLDEAPAGTMVLMLGAGTITNVAHRLAQRVASVSPVAT
jgi:UDP-N-acetylmuramate--alanine ligase